MALNIDNADFRMFTDFAATAKSTARASIVGPTTLGGTERTIKAANNFDFIGNVGRLSRYKTANDNVRQLFRDTIANMFGGENHIPENVLKAMKLEDYGKGKPLTARRIKAVKTEVERFAQAAKAAGDKAMAALGGDGTFTNLPKAAAEALEKTVRGALESCKNADVLEVASKNITAICLRGNQVRGEAEIKARIDGIKANFEEIRTAAKGNQEILKAGKFMMDALAGKSLPPGRIGTLVKLATGNDVKMDAFKRLKASPEPVTIARALIQLKRNVNSVLDSADIKFGVAENDVKTPTRDFIARVMLQSLGRSTLRSIQTALSGKDAIELYNLGDVVGKEGFKELPIDTADIQEAIMGDRDQAIPSGLRREIRNATSSLFSLDLFFVRANIAEILDETAPEMQTGDKVVLPADTLEILAEIKNAVIETGSEQKN